MPAQQLSRGQAIGLSREIIGFLNGLVDALNSLKAVANPDAPPLAVSVDSDDASDLATVITLANEIKSDLNLAIAYINLFAENVNNLQIGMRAAGLLDEE